MTGKHAERKWLVFLSDRLRNLRTEATIQLGYENKGAGIQERAS
jgi:hypothetical protein